MAIERVLDLKHQGHKVILDADIQGFFENIPHSVMMTGPAKVVTNGNILGLVKHFLRAGVMKNGVFKPTTVGTSQRRDDLSIAGEYRPELPELATGPAETALRASRQ